MRKSQEIRNRIVVADIFHHLFQKLQVRRVLPVFHPVSDLIAENPAEIFVAREGEEAAGVGQHANEGREHADAGKRRKLGFHAVFVIVEPPCGTLLDLCNSSGILETSKDRTDGLVIVWI